MENITITTTKQKQVVDITDDVQKVLFENQTEDGVCHVFVTHTTAAVTTADLDPGTDLDMLDAFEVMIPKLNYRHPHNPAHVPDHILASLIGPSVTVPMERKRLVLGQWQRIALFEFDGPRKRSIVITSISV